MTENQDYIFIEIDIQKPINHLQRDDKLSFHIRLCKDEEQNKGGRGKEGGWETTCYRTPTQSWVMNEKDPPKDALKKWSKYPKAAMMEFAKLQGKKNRGMVNCFHSWLAGWENENLRFKVQLTMIKVIFRSPYLAWRDSLRSNPVQSPHLSHTCLCPAF